MLKKLRNLLSCILSIVMVISLLPCEYVLGADAVGIDGGDDKKHATMVSQGEYIDELSESESEEWFSFTTPDYECWTNMTFTNQSVNNGIFYAVYTAYDEKKAGDYITYNGSKSLELKLQKNTIYYLHIIRRYTGNNGFYKFNFSFLDDPDSDTKDRATEITLNTKYERDIVADADDDWFKFTAPISGEYKVYAKNNNISYNYGKFNLRIRTENSEELLCIQVDYGEETTKTVTLEKGKIYYVRCQTPSISVGNYSFSITPPEQLNIKDINECTVKLNQDTYTYSGSECKPVVTVKDAGTVLTENTDYTVAYQNNVNAGQAKVIVTGMGNYAGTVTKYFTIQEAEGETKDISGCSVRLEQESYTYTGSECKPAVTVKDGSKTLMENVDYTLTYHDNVNAGLAGVTVTGIGDYRGSVTNNFTINAKQPSGEVTGHGLSNPSKDEDGNTVYDCVYFGHYWQEDTNGDGKANKKDAKTSIKWRVLSVDGDDAFLIADKNLDVQNYNSEFKSVTWETCTMRSWLNGYGAEFNAEGIDYTGAGDNFMGNAFSAGELEAILSTTLENKDNQFFGTSGGNDTSDKIFLLSIEDIANADYGFINFDLIDCSSGDIAGIEYNDGSNRYYPVYDYAKLRTNTAFAKGEDAAVSGYFVTSNIEAEYWWLRSPGDDSRYAAYVDYAGVVYVGSLNVGDHPSECVCPALHLNLSSGMWSKAGTLTCKSGSFGGETCSHEWGDGRVTTEPTCITEGVKIYTCSKCGKTKEEKVAKTENHIWDGETVVREPTTESEGMKTYKCTVCGMVVLEAMSKLPIYEDKNNISACSVTLSRKTYEYTGSACKPTVIVKDESKTLTENTDYTLVYQNNVNVGQACVTITGMGAYTGTYTIYFTIEAKPSGTLPGETHIHEWGEGKITAESTCKTTGVKIYTCSKCGVTKEEEIAATENHTWDAGTVTTEPTSADEGIKTYKCMVCGGTKTETVPKLSVGDTLAGTVVTPPKVSKVSGLKAKAKKKALSISWKKLSGVSGYELQWSMKSGFKGAKTKRIARTKKSYTISKLGVKKKYYVRIRAYTTYKDAGGKTAKAYGKWVKISKKTK